MGCTFLARLRHNSTSKARSTSPLSSLHSNMSSRQPIRTWCSSSSKSSKCNKQWRWWHLKEIRAGITLSRWRCFNKCNKWLQWCKIWWISNLSRHSSSPLNKLSKSNLRNSQTQLTICFLIYSKVQHQVASCHISLIIIWICQVEVSANHILPLQQQQQLNKHPCFQRLEPNLPSHRVIQITHLICSIDK